MKISRTLAIDVWRLLEFCTISSKSQAMTSGTTVETSGKENANQFVQMEDVYSSFILNLPELLLTVTGLICKALKIAKSGFELVQNGLSWHSA